MGVMVEAAGCDGFLFDFTARGGMTRVVLGAADGNGVVVEDEELEAAALEPTVDADPRRGVGPDVSFVTLVAALPAAEDREDDGTAAAVGFVGTPGRFLGEEAIEEVFAGPLGVARELTREGVLELEAKAAELVAFPVVVVVGRARGTGATSPIFMTIGPPPTAMRPLLCANNGVDVDANPIMESAGV